VTGSTKRGDARLDADVGDDDAAVGQFGPTEHEPLERRDETPVDVRERGGVTAGKARV